MLATSQEQAQQGQVDQISEQPEPQVKVPPPVVETIHEAVDQAHPAQQSPSEPLTTQLIFIAMPSTSSRGDSGEPAVSRQEFLHFRDTMNSIQHTMSSFFSSFQGSATSQ